MNHSFRFAAALAVSAVLATGLPAQQSTTSDAVIQANVLKSMAANTRLASQQIQTTTAFGTVTITGSVPDEATRNTAEQVVAHTAGVKKVIDQLTVGTSAEQPQAQTASETPQSPEEQAGLAALNEPNGPPNQQTAPEAAHPQAPQAPRVPQQPQPYPLPDSQQQVGQTYPQQQPYPQQQQRPSYPQQQQPYPQQSQYPQQPTYSQQPAYPQQPNDSQPYPQQTQPNDQQPRYPQYSQQQPYPQQQPYSQQQPYPQQQVPYASSGGYPSQQPAPGMYRRQYEAQQQGYPQPPYDYGPQAGQPGGQHVTIAPGVVLPVRITRWLSSGDAQPGSTFTAVVENDVVANGLIAIPRGAQVQGSVVDAKGAGALRGRGSLTLQLTSLYLGGQVIPLQSQTFTVEGQDKAAQSVNSAIGGAAVGAIIGAIAGRGTGAAIGAGVGGAAGLGAAAVSGGGNARIPAEALLRFPLTAPVDLLTVSEAEMQRLGSYAGPEGARRPLPPPGYGYGGYPAPYPGPYGYRGGYYY